jgi:hypothetical protein
MHKESRNERGVWERLGALVVVFDGPINKISFLYIDDI